MSEELITIAGAARSKAGKGYNRKLRVAGKIPANLMEKGKSTMIELEAKLLPKAWKSEARTFKLDLAGTVNKVKIQELQYDPLTRAAVHVDLLRV